MRRVRKVVTMRSGEARIVSTKRWLEFTAGLSRDGLEPSGHNDDACEEFCETRGGVDLCGGSVVLCNNGETGVITGDP